MATESRRKGIKLVIALCVIVALAVTGVLIWTSRRATVRFYSEVESNIENISVSIGGTIDQPKDPVAKDPGYSFGGWYSDPNYLTEFDFDLPIQKDTTVYVKWVRRSFTVTVLRATTGGNFYEVLWTGSAKYKESISLPGTSTFMNYSWMGADDARQYPFRRANQNFLGFATRDNGIGDYNYTYLPDSSFTIPNTSVQLYAVFRGDERSFIFNPNDGEGSEKTEKGYFNENFTVPTSEGLSKKYYTFAYWCTNADGIPRDSEGNPLADVVDPVTGEVTEKAENNENCVNVYWPGQTFKINNTEPMTLYAIWKRNKVNIMIDARGGSNSLGTDGDNLVDAGLEGGYDLSTITKPTRDGYRLISYNTQENGLGTTYSLDAVLQVEEEDIALYAIWQRHLTVGYTLNTNKASDDKLTEAGGYEDFVGIDGESFTVKDIPVTVDIPNFRFLGWSLDSEATQAEYHSGDTFVLRESDFDGGVDKIYLYGIWQGDARVLRLKNTSDNQIQEISSHFGRLERLTTTPVNVDVNYMFVGWGTVEEYNYKNPDSYTGRIYEVGSQFEMGTNTEIGESRDILYSLWCPYSYDITYYTQGGRLTAISAEDQANGYYIKDYVYKETITLYSQVEREGYRFMGWAYSSNSQECAFPTEGENGYTLVMPGNPIQLYAVWQKEYTVTFYNNADDASGLVTAITGKILGETITIPTEEVSNTGITRDNYTIIGWGSKPDGGTVYEFGVEVVLESSDMISYYAIWQGDARYVEVYNGVTKVATIEGHYGEDIPLAFEEEIADADPGQEIGGFYAMLKTSPTAEPTRYDFPYGSNIKTTTLYFKDENGAAVNTLKVYIEWTNKYFSVVYELNGGIYNNDDNDDMSAYRIYKQYTTEVTLESGIPTKTRYEFKGWTETPDDDNPVLYAAGGKFVIPSHDVTLYAYWARIYSISFNSNGGTLAEDADESDLRAGSYSKGTNFIIPNNVYERTNYTFKCWSTKASGATGAGGEDYNVGDTLTITSDITLYAVWQGQEVNVTLISVDPGNAAYETRTVQITPTPRYGDTISLGTYSSVIPAPDQGLTLKGWVIGRQPTELDIEVEYTNDYTIDSVGNIEIYAVWSAKKFYFTVSLSGGVCNNSYSDQAESYAFRQKIDMTYYSNRIKKEGYRLIGYSNAASTTEADYAVDSFISMPNASKKVFCVWIELAIITFDKNCESDTLENYVFEGVPNDAIDGEINLTNVNKMFTRDNYTLLGWSTSSTATTPDAGFSIDNDTYRILSTQDIYLFAVWEGRAIQVVFNANGGQGSNTQEQRKYGDVIDLTVDKYKRTHSDEGFSFGGWSRVAGYDNANSTVGSSFTVSTDKITDASITLYAIWNKRYFTLTLSYGDSTLGSKANPDGYDSKQVQYTSTIDLTQYVTQAKKRLGYDFLGWAENQYETNASKIYGAPDADGNPTNVEFTMPNSAVTLYALWNPIYVDIIYISDTPSGATATWSGVTPGVQSYTSKELYQLSFKLPSNKITESVSVVVPTYRFVGWILDGDSTQTIRKEGNWLQVSSRSPMTLRAQWEENRITVAVNGNGGIFVDSNSGTQQSSIKEMSTYTLPTATELVRAGYRLSGYTVGGNRYDLAANPTIQITTSLIDQADIASNTVRITMLWIQQFTVSFNANNKYNDGTTGSIDDRTVDSGTAIVLPNCSATEGFNRPHYKFLYWNTQPDGKGTTYNSGISVTVYASYTLYAIWEGDDRQITLNFSTNKVGKWSGGDVTTKTFSGLKYGDEIDLGKTDYTGECTENAGFKLGGWTDIPYDASNPSAFNVKFLFGSIYTVEGEDSSPNIQLYAVWEARSYKVSYDTNGGVFSDGSNRKDGAEIAYGNNFTVDGSFVGYNPSATKQFYTLVGWSIDRNFDWNKKNTRPTSWEEPSNLYNYVVKSGTGAEIAGFKMPSKDVVLYAIWEPVQINISIYNDKDSMGTVSDTQTVRYGDTYTLRTISEADAAQIKPDHNFDKWQHLNTDKSTILGSYAGGTTLKISEELMSENEATTLSNRTMIFVGTWIPQTVYFIIDGNEGLFGENNTHTVQSSVGREIVLPKVKETDSSYQLTRENFALDSFNTTRNGSGASYKPGATIQIPSLNDSRVKEETITFGDEEITTYVFRVYAQWQEAEAYIYLSDTRKENPFYKTLGEAIDDAATGNRVIIIKDCYIKSKITISKSVTIEAEDSDKNIYRYIGIEDNNFADAYKGVCIEVTTTGQLNVGVNSEDYEGPVIYFDGQSGKYTTVVESFIVLKGSATIYNGVVFRNTYAATGGVFSVDDTNASLVLKYVSFDTNIADGNGGAIAITKANNISISNSNFYGNISKNGFGGAVSNNGTLDLQANLFERNQAARGGAIYNTGDVTDRNNIYNINIAQNYGGAIYNSGNLYSLTGGDAGYAGSVGGIFTNNTANTAGGAVYNDATTGTADNMIISNVTFGLDDDEDYEKANSANSGGAVFNAGKINISSSRFYFNNTVDNGEGGAIGTNGTKATLLIKGCTLKGNKANKGNGGALYIASGIATIGEDGASSSVNTFIGNSVTTGKGHAMAVAGGTANVYYAIFRDHVFTENSNYGGVVNQNGGVLNFFGGTITENTLLSTENNNVGGYGGGLLISNGTCNIKNLTIDNNTAKYGGGIAIIGSGSVVMTNGEIYANQAGLGGGIYLRDSNSSLTLNGGMIGAPNEEQGNQAVGFDDSNLGLGGGIYAKGTVNINGATIRYNYSNGNGGGIYTNSILNLVSGKINNNSCARSGGAVYADATGGGTNGSVRFKCSSAVSFVIEGNLCADGSYPLCAYDESSVGYANGIYAETKVIISGYMVIGYNSDESILNDIFLAVRDTATNPTSKIVIFDSSESYKLNSETKICISSIVAVMGDKLVLFPSVTDAKNEISKFSFAGDDAGFRLDEKYLKLGNYAATIIRGGNEVFYSTLTEAYLDAASGETINVYKNIVLTNDLAIYEESNGLADIQEAALGANKVAGVSIQDTFYISKKVTLVSGGDYSITRGDLTGDMFTVVGDGQLILGTKTPGSTMLTIKGGGDVATGSIVKVEFSESFTTGALADEYQLTVYNGVKLTQNKAEKGGAIYNQGKVVVKGGEITRNKAEADDGGLGGGIYSEGTTSFLYLTEDAKISYNTAYEGGGIFINSDSDGSNALVMDSATAAVTYNTTTYAGGGIYILDGAFNMTAGEISYNTSNEMGGSYPGGGGVYLASGSSMETNAKATNNETNAAYIQIKNNKTKSAGGGVAVDNATFTFNIGYITENNATVGGGVAVINTSNVEGATGQFISKNTGYYNHIVANTATNGGAINVVKGSATLSYIKITDNTASNGAGIYVEDTLSVGYRTYVGDASTGKGNTAEKNGGGIFISNDGTLTQFEGNTSSGQNLIVSANEATTGMGGGICNYGIVTFNYFTDIYGNRAQTGGGIANAETSSELYINAYGMMYRNTATGEMLGGGGLYNIGLTQLNKNYLFGSSSTIADGNSAVRGGGIYNVGDFIVGSETEKKAIGGVNISYNTATLFGGGLYMSNGRFVDYNTSTLSINNNSQTLAAGGGGGICIDGGTVITKYYPNYNMKGTTLNYNCWMRVEANSSNGTGGGMLITGSSESGIILNSFYCTSNSATGRGGGLAVLGASKVYLGSDSLGENNGTSYISSNNTSSVGASMYLDTVLYVQSNLNNWWMGNTAWAGEIYLATSRAYLDFKKSGENTSYYPSVAQLNIRANSYTDGRRIAKFGSYIKTIQEVGAGGGKIDVEYRTTFAEDYYKKFVCNVSNNYGVGYDDNGYVVFAEPVAYNYSRGTYHSTLAQACEAARSNDTIAILKSHTITDQVKIIDKTIYFVNAADIILTRSPKLLGDMFRIFGSNLNNSYNVYFNYNWGTPSNGPLKGLKCGDNTLTLDGNKDNPTLKQQTINKWGSAGTYYNYASRGSLIGLNGGLYRLDENNKVVPYTTNASHLFGHKVVQPSENLYVNGSKITTTTHGNWNVWPARIGLNVRNTVFKNNFSAYAGGAITFKGYSSGSNYSTLSVQNCTFENNETGYYSWQATTRGEGYSFYQSGAGGGAIFALGGYSDIRNCTFTDNTSASHGGAISSILQEANTNAGFYINNCTFSNNKALYGNGGAIELVSNKGNISWSNMSFYNNAAYSKGGAVYFTRTTKTYQNLIDEGYVYGNGHNIYVGIFEEKTTAEGYVNNVTNWGSVEAWSTIDGKAYFSLDSNCVFEGNSVGKGYWGKEVTTTGGAGGGLYVRHYLRVYNSNTNRIEGNTATGNGGGIYTQYVPYLWASQSFIVRGNSSTGYGGGIYFEQLPYYNYNYLVDGNSAVHGGGLYFNQRGSAYAITVTNNTASKSGGGIYFGTNKNNSVVNCIITDNSAVEYGGGIAAPNSAGQTIALCVSGSGDISYNKAGLAGGGIYCYGSLAVIGDNTINIVENEVYSTKSDLGGGGALWSYWEVIVSGTVSFLNNKITSPTPLNRGGGGAIFLYEDELWLTAGVFYSANGANTSYNALNNWRTFPDDYLYCYGRSRHGLNTYASGGNGHTNWTDSSSNSYTRITGATISMSGNDAGLSAANGIYYWGYNMYISGNLKITDEVYLYRSSATLNIDNYIDAGQCLPLYVKYPNNPNDGTTMVRVPQYVYLISSIVGIFNVDNDGYYTTFSGMYGTGTQRATDTAKVTVKKGSVNVIVNADVASGETVNGMGSITVQVGFGDAMTTVYQKVRPSYPGHTLNHFSLLREDGSKIKDLGISSGWFFPTRDEIINWFGTVPEQITLKTVWSTSTYTLYIYKAINNGSAGVLYGNATINNNGSANYTYQIGSNESMREVMEWLETTASTKDSTVNKNYLAGYTFSHYMLEDRRTYTKEDIYPYVGNKTLYMCYVLAEYKLTFTAGADGELLTTNNVLKVKFRANTTMLSGNLVYRSGYKLKAWLGSDGKTYDLNKNYNTFTQDLTLEPIWEATTYQVRVYYNYPDGGTSFKVYSVYAGELLAGKLNQSPIANPMGYTLKGYATAASSSIDGYQEIDENYEMPGQDLIVYAQWSPIKVTISYYDEKQLNLLYQEEVDFGTDIELQEINGVSLWLNVGSITVYNPGGSYYVSNTGQYYLIFRAYSLSS